MQYFVQEHRAKRNCEPGCRTLPPLPCFWVPEPQHTGLPAGPRCWRTQLPQQQQPCGHPEVPGVQAVITRGCRAEAPKLLFLHGLCLDAVESLETLPLAAKLPIFQIWRKTITQVWIVPSLPAAMPSGKEGMLPPSAGTSPSTSPPGTTKHQCRHPRSASWPREGPAGCFNY